MKHVTDFTFQRHLNPCAISAVTGVRACSQSFFLIWDRRVAYKIKYKIEMGLELPCVHLLFNKGQ